MIGQRLKFERERLAKTQPEFAAIAGVGKTTVIHWEKDDSSPTAVQLAVLSEAGVDVFYVMTGQRIVSPGQERLTQDEIEILVNYRRSREEDRQALARTAAAMAKQEEPKAKPRKPRRRFGVGAQPDKVLLQVQEDAPAVVFGKPKPRGKKTKKENE